MRSLIIIAFLFTYLFSFSQSYFVTEKDAIKLSNEGLEYYQKNLQSSYDLTNSVYWPPLYTQTDWVCNQVAASYYMMSYETNALRDFSSQEPENLFSIYFPWNFGNGGYGWFGDHYIITMEMFKQFGVPSLTGCPYDNPPDSSRWMTGYDLYYGAMKNRIENYYGIRVNSEDGLTSLKSWVYNHGGTHYGGTATFLANTAASGYGFLPAGTPHAGAYVVGICGDNALHARTIVGYDDNICYDYNNDGQYTNTIDLNGDGIIDVHDWEKGGFKLAESNGPTWQGDGYMWIMYKAMVDEYGHGGILNNLVHVMIPDIDYEPLLTTKFEISHPSREKIKISVGVSSDIEASTWEYLMDFPIFNYQGGKKFMQGGENDEDKTLEAGLDITKLLEYFNSDGCAKLFFVVDESDGADSYEALLNHCSFIDYSGTNPQEYVAISAPLELSNNSRSVVSVVVCAESIERPEILSSTIPVLSTQGNNYFEILHNATSNSNNWEILPYFDISQETRDFDMFSGTQLTPSSYFNGIVDLELPFAFPFGNSTTNKIKIHTDGYIFPSESANVWNQFRENLYPLFINEEIIAPLSRFSLVCDYEEGDGIWYKVSGDTVKIRWKGSDEWAEAWTRVDFGCNLISDGTIEFTYGESFLNNMYPNIGGISYGNQSDNIICWKDRFIPAVNSIIKITPYKVPTGLNINSDGVLYGTPAEYSNYPFRVQLTDANRISDTQTYFLNTTIEETVVDSENVEIFPNPVNENLIVEILNEELDILSVEIYNSEGKVLNSIEISSFNGLSLDLTDFKSGIYFLKIITNRGSINKQIIKI